MEPLAAHYVDSDRALQPLIQHLAGQPVVGLDTEFISEGRYEPALCLVQVSTPEGIWILDPLAVPDLGKFWKVLTDAEREVVAVAARQEIRFCARGAGRIPGKVLDVQIAAGLLGYGYPLSHTNLVYRLLNIRVHSGESFTDWRKRPLTTLQLRYAADDVRYLLEMRAKLQQKAEKMGRTEWVAGECARLAADVTRDEEKWRIAGSTRMSRRQLGVLRELWRWRDNAARLANLPSMRVLSDAMLLEVAQRSPNTVEDLFAIRGLDRKIFRKSEAAMVEAVRRGRQLPDDDLPTNDRREDPQQVAVLAKLLSVASNGLAAEFEVDPALLATTADLQATVRWFLDRDGAPKPSILEGWRGEILAEPLLGFLEGRKVVRVGNAKRANPLVFEDFTR